MTGLGAALRGEWTKLATVRSTALALVATVGLTVLISLLGASGSRTFANDGPHTIDQLHFVHRPLTGDGTVAAHVLSQQDSSGWAKAGLLIKDGTASGSPYAAVMVTPRHGVRMQADFSTEFVGSGGGSPRWLRLTRAGSSVTGSESTDGLTWRTVGTVDVPGLPATAEVGLFVTSPDAQQLTRVGPGSIEIGSVPTDGRATFGGVRVSGPAAPWRSDDVQPARPTKDGAPLGGLQSSAGGPGSSTTSGDVVTVTGVGDLGRIGMGGVTIPPDTDLVRNSLTGVQVGLVAVVALGVLFMTSEYRSGLIRSTLVVSPQRGRLLVAKSVVLGAVVFAAGLVASVAALYGSQPLARSRGFAPPAYGHPSLSDGPVLRAVVGTALFLMLIAVFSLAVGALLRSTALAVVIIVALVLVLPIVSITTSTGLDVWVNRATPNAGLAVQRTLPLPDVVIGPWAGLGVLAVWAAAALAVAGWRLRSRDA